jgi:hypothetical protein
MPEKEVEALRAENAALRERLEVYQRAINELYAKLDDEPPLTDEEIHDLITSPRGQPLTEVLEEYERELRSA